MRREGKPVPPAPRLPDGHPDLGNTTGAWFGPTIGDMSGHGHGTSNIGGGAPEARPEQVVDVPFLPWAEKAYNERQAVLGKDDAFMLLALANAQSGLTTLERGKHALTMTTRYGANGDLSIAKYAKHVGRPERSVKNELYAAEVYCEVDDCKSAYVGRLENYFQHLIAIHAAPREHWVKLVEQMLERNWSRNEVQAAVKELQPKKVPPPKPVITHVTLTDWKRWTASSRPIC